MALLSKAFSVQDAKDLTLLGEALFSLLVPWCNLAQPSPNR